MPGSMAACSAPSTRRASSRSPREEPLMERPAQIPSWAQAEQIAHACAARYARNAHPHGVVEYGDLLGAALGGAWEAYRGFEPGRGASFVTYCFNGCLFSMSAALRCYEPLSRKAGDGRSVSSGSG